MPYVPPVTLANGSVLGWGQVQSNLDAARTYLNAINFADLTDASIDRLHIVDPLIRGYPMQRMEGEAHRAGWGDFGHMIQPGESPKGWSGRPQRILIAPQLVDSSDGVWRTGVGVTLPVPTQPGGFSEFVMQIMGAAQIRSYDNGTGGPLYPNGAGGGGAAAGFAGYVCIERTTRSTGARARFTDGRFLLYPQEIFDTVLSGYNNDRWHTMAIYSAGQSNRLVGGETYDFQLVYVRDTCKDGIVQIDLSEILVSWMMA